MNENLERLKELKADLEGIEREHSDILGKESDIGRPLHQAADAARRKYKQVSEGRISPTSEMMLPEDYLTRSYGVWMACSCAGLYEKDGKPKCLCGAREFNDRQNRIK